jgi:hypothetical protein
MAVRLILAVLICLPWLMGCSNDSTPAQTVTKPSNEEIVVNDAVSSAIAQFSGRAKQPLAEFGVPAKLLYPIQRDGDGVQFWISGDHTRKLITMLSSAYGPPKLLQTNRQGWLNAAYTSSQVGANLSVFSGATKHESYTHIIIARP